MVFGKDQDPRVGSSARWSKPRPAAKEKRVRTLPTNSPVEIYYMTRAREMGLVPEGTTRNAHRRIAKRLSDSDVARKLEATVAPEPAHIDDDDALLLSHLEREAGFWRARASRDRQIADEHDRKADEAEASLVDLMFRLGVAH